MSKTVTLTYMYDRDTPNCHRYILDGELPIGLVYFPEKIYFEKDTTVPQAISIRCLNMAEAKEQSKLRKVK